MPEVVDWEHTANQRAAVHRAACALAEGEVVAFPTEVAYVLTASALFPTAVARLRQSQQCPEDRLMSLAVVPQEKLSTGSRT